MTGATRVIHDLNKVYMTLMFAPFITSSNRGQKRADHITRVYLRAATNRNEGLLPKRQKDRAPARFRPPRCHARYARSTRKSHQLNIFP
jgi:hypothetical protein